MRCNKSSNSVHLFVAVLFSLALHLSTSPYTHVRGENTDQQGLEQLEDNEIIAHWDSNYHALITTDAHTYATRCAGVDSGKLIFAEFEQTQLEAMHNLSQGLPVRALVHYCDFHEACGGLADRMRGAIAVLLAAMTSKRAFFLHHVRPIDMTRLFRPLSKHLNFSLPDNWNAIVTANNMTVLKKRMMAGSANQHIPNFATIDLDNEFYNHSDVLMVAGNVQFMSALLVNPGTKPILNAMGIVSDVNLAYCLLNYIFHPTDLIISHLDKYTHGLISNLSLGDPKRRDAYIAIHVRIGNTSHTTDKSRVPMTALDDFFSCATALENRMLRSFHNLRTVRWLIASDADEVVRDALSKFGSRKVVTIPGPLRTSTRCTAPHNTQSWPNTRGLSAWWSSIC